MAEGIHLTPGVGDAIIRHCLQSLPNEGCGLWALSGDRIVEIYPTANAEASPTAFTVPPEEHHAALKRAESRGWELGGSFHSHPQGGPVPSDRDLERALDPDWVYLIVGLEGQPQVRAWHIRNRAALEVPLRSGEW